MKRASFFSALAIRALSMPMLHTCVSLLIFVTWQQFDIRNVFDPVSSKLMWNSRIHIQGREHDVTECTTVQRCELYQNFGKLSARGTLILVFLWLLLRLTKQQLQVPTHRLSTKRTFLGSLYSWMTRTERPTTETQLKQSIPALVLLIYWVLLV